MSKISIIVPVYNAEKYIEKCVNSLTSQTYKDIEIILINDGSTDSSLKICEKFERVDSRIKLYSKENGGVSSARNLGISKCKGKYICFVDSDDTVDIDFCEILVSNLENSKSDLSCCSYNIIKNGQKEKKYKKEKKDKYITEDKYMQLLKCYKGFLWNKLYKKKIIDENRLKLDENISMCEDLLFNFQYLAKCKKIICSNEKKYNYIINNFGLSKGINKTWFDILYVYNYLYTNISKYDERTRDNIILEFMYAISEAEMRSKIMNIKKEEVFKKYNIDYKSIYMKQYRKMLNSQYILLKEKIKLIIFFKFKWVAMYIKFGRM